MYGQYDIPKNNTLINFSIGQPSTSFLPLDLIKYSLASISNIHDKTLLQYGDIKGYYAFRRDLANFLQNEYTQPVDPNNILITNGITGALALICSIFSTSNTLVIVEEPTYFLALNIFKDFNLDIISVEIEKDGINTDTLKKIIEKNSSKNIILYTIPAFHNPTGYTMSDKKRKIVGHLSDTFNIIVIADEVYHLLYFNDEDKPPLPLTYYGNNIISLGSFSKILAPSLRLGWIHTNSKTIMDKIVNCGQLDSSGGINPFISAIVHPLLNKRLNNHLKFLREELQIRCISLCSALNNNNLGITYNIPKGGYFVWANLPINSNNLNDLFTMFKIKYNSGNKFSATNSLKNYIRLSFSCYSQEDIKLGINRLLEMIEYYSKKQNLLNVGIIGYNGKLGAEIVELLKEDKDIDTIITIDRLIAYKPTGINDVIVDVSSSEGTKNIIQYLLEKKIVVPIIIGTTGKLPMELINTYSRYASVSLVPNFSYGISILTNINTLISNQDWKIELCEKHHARKKDSPSGTALLIKGCIDNDITITSIREGNILGDHNLTLTNKYEKIELNHSIINYKVFSVGCLHYLKKKLQRIPGIYTLKNMSSNLIKNINLKGNTIKDKNNISFYKYSVCGNTFIILKEQDTKNIDIKLFITKICDTTEGLYSDGVILYDVYDECNPYKFIWTYYNSDGSKANFCGNGAQCIAYHYLRTNNIENIAFINSSDINTYGKLVKNNISITINNIIKKINLNYLNIENLLNNYNNNNFNLSYIGTYSVGVPHIIISCSNLYDINIELIVNYLYQKNNIFKNYNINFIELGATDINIRTYEKGVYNETASCGSGSIAVGYVYRNTYEKIIINTSRNDKVNILFKDKNIILSSNVKQLFKGVYNYII